MPLMLLSLSLCAQRYRNGTSDFGVLLGASNYFGDIAPEICIRETHAAGGLLYRYQHNSFFSSRYQFTYARISGNDQNFKGNAYRNISFQSDIYELAYFTEFNFKPFGMNYNQGEKKRSTFVFAGVNMFMFNPVHVLPGGDKVELRDIGTEGQLLNGKKRYALVQPAFTMGLGYKFNLKKGTVLGFELGFRKTFTDYLDDTKGTYADYNAMVAKQGTGAGELSHPETLNGNPPIQAGSMRGDRNFTDWYFILGLTLTFRNVVGDPCSGL